MFCFLFLETSLMAKQMTLRIHCWEGYSKPYTKEFIKIIKDKYDIDLDIIITNVSNPQEFWELARAKKVDLISPAHNIPRNPTRNFIESPLKVVLPINLNNIPNYKYLINILKKNNFVTVDGIVYGVPYTMGPYGLAYNSMKVPEPDSWNVLCDKKSKGLITISKDYPECNIYTAALILGAPYDALYNYDQLKERVPLSAIQAKLNSMAINAYSFWEGTANPDEFSKLSYAATWGYAVATVNKKGGKWKMAKPKEGTTLWVDHWLIVNTLRKDPLRKRICEEWINYCLSPALQVAVIRNWGVSPVVYNIKDKLTEDEIKTFNVGDHAYWESLSLWKNQNARTLNSYRKFWETAIKTRK